MATIERYNHHVGRYYYDQGMCAGSKDFAQVDTRQDAEYYGTWANPFTFVIVNYCEGDVTIKQCADTAEFCKEMRELKQWADSFNSWKGVDPGPSDRQVAVWYRVGLADLLHYWGELPAAPPANS